YTGPGAQRCSASTPTASTQAEQAVPFGDDDLVGPMLAQPGGDLDPLVVQERIFVHDGMRRARGDEGVPRFVTGRTVRERPYESYVTRRVETRIPVHDRLAMIARVEGVLDFPWDRAEGKFGQHRVSW